MFKKNKLIIITLSVVVIFSLLVVLFYTIPYIRLNELILYTNKNVVENIDDETLISNENMKAMQIIDKKDLLNTLANDSVYISVKTKKKSKLVSWNEMHFICDITVIGKDAYSSAEIFKYFKTKKIIFAYDENKWKIISVCDQEKKTGDGDELK
jgi:hypothetical protein